MTADEREIRRKRRILDHAGKSGNIAKTNLLPYWDWSGWGLPKS